MRYRSLALAAMFAAFLSAPLAAQTKVYSNLPDGPTPPHPPNVVSEGYDADGDAQAGEQVSIIPGTYQLSSMNLIVSDWAYCSEWSTLCANNPVGFLEPITVSFYSTDASGDITGTLYTATQTKLIPWRAEPNPGMCGSLPDFSTFGEWYAPDDACHGGEAFTEFFDLSASDLTLPSTFVVGIAYNTGNYGASPYGVAGPYNSLNVGLNVGCSASIGIDDCVPYANTSYPGFSTNGAFEQNGILDGYSPLIEIDGIQQSTPDTSVPEPGTMAMMAVGLVGMTGAGFRRKKRKV